MTGGAGFVGSHLVDRLMQAGQEVICLDNYFTGRKIPAILIGGLILLARRSNGMPGGPGQACPGPPGIPFDLLANKIKPPIKIAGILRPVK